MRPGFARQRPELGEAAQLFDLFRRVVVVEVFPIPTDQLHRLEAEAGDTADSILVGRLPLKRPNRRPELHTRFSHLSFDPTPFIVRAVGETTSAAVTLRIVGLSVLSPWPPLAPGPSEVQRSRAKRVTAPRS